MIKIIQKEVTVKPEIVEATGSKLDMLALHGLNSENLKALYIGQYKVEDKVFGNEYYTILVDNSKCDEKEVVTEYDISLAANLKEKIELQGKNYEVLDKIMHLNGNITYYLESNIVKCNNYDSLLESKSQEAKLLLEQRQLENNKEDIFDSINSRKPKKKIGQWLFS